MEKRWDLNASMSEQEVSLYVDSKFGQDCGRECCLPFHGHFNDKAKKKEDRATDEDNSEVWREQCTLLTIVASQLM